MISQARGARLFLFYCVVLLVYDMLDHTETVLLADSGFVYYITLRDEWERILLVTDGWNKLVGVPSGSKNYYDTTGKSLHSKLIT